MNTTLTAVVSSPGRPKPRPPRVPVLVVLHWDGCCEVFGEGIDVHVAQALCVEQPDEALVDEYLDATLPARFRRLHYPNKLVVAACCESRSPEMELARREAIQTLRELREVTQ